MTPLAPVKTRNRAVDALFAALVGDDHAIKVAADALLGAKLEGLGSALVAHVEEIATALERASLAETPRDSHDGMRQHVLMFEVLARAAVVRRDPGADELLARLARSSSSEDVRSSSVRALAAEGASAIALQHAASFFDPEKPDWLMLYAVTAMLRVDPAAAFARLADYLAPPHASTYPIGAPRSSKILEALTKTKLGAIDARWFGVAGLLLDLPEQASEPSPEWFFKKHPTSDALAAVAAATERALAEKRTIHGTALRFLEEHATAAAIPLLVRVAEVGAPFGDYRMTLATGALERLDDASAVPLLEALVARGPSPKAKKSLCALVKHLSRHAPKAVAAKKKSTRKPSLEEPQAKLAARLERAGVAAERAEQLAVLARNRIVIAGRAMKGDPAIATSRLGGLPDLPRGAAWPSYKVSPKRLEEQLVLGLDEYPKATFPAAVGGTIDVPLAFVGQLDLSELAPHDTEHRLPKRGLLQFFARQEIVLDDEPDLPRVACAVLFHAGPASKLEPREPPATLPKGNRAKGARIELDSHVVLPPSNAASLERMALLDVERQSMTKVVDEDASLGEKHPHQALGDARANYFRGVPSKKHTLLLAVGSSGPGSLTWGDAGQIFFCISDAALAAGKWSEAYAMLDE